MLILIGFIAGALIILLITMAMNLLTFPKLSAEDSLPETNMVSILIPARNEAQVIASTIEKLLSQTYTNYEVILLDDHSEDETGRIACDVAGDDERFRLIEGTTLPKNWMGKNWACHQLAQAAQGEIFIFTDADVQWQPDSLSAVVAEMKSSKADMVTVWSTQVTETLPERLTVPLIAMVILGYLPTIMVHHSPFSLFAAANGQCMAWRREAYEAVGGHQAVANNVLDDVTLAKLAKKHGFAIRMVDGAGLIRTRMYDSWQRVRDGFAKNILAGYGSAFALMLGTIFHWLIFLVPLVLLFWTEYRLWAVILIGAGLSLRTVSAIFSKQRVLDAPLLPVSVILFTIIAFQSLYWHYTGGSQWKGRRLET